MPNIVYLTKKTGMGFNEIMKLPYTVFLSYIRENYILDMMETEEGRKHLEQIKRLNVTAPDLNKIRQLDSFKQKEGEN